LPVAPGEQLLFHGIFQGDQTPAHYPVPCAEGASISFLAAPEVVREILVELDFAIHG
jgi:hypothetical protein